MRVVIYANCQGIGVKTIIPLLTRNISEDHISNFENYKIISGEDSYDNLIRAAGQAEVFIYQPLGASQGKFSTVAGEDNVMSRVHPDARKISFPYIYNNGLWPLYHEGTVQNAAPIDALFAAGANAYEIIEAYDAGEIFFNIEERVAQSPEVLAGREAETDVKVADFLRTHIRSRELMLTQNHPTTETFIHAIDQMLTIMLEGRYARPDLDLASLGNNYAALPGRYPIDERCVEEGGITYTRGPEEGAKVYYLSLIHI